MRISLLTDENISPAVISTLKEAGYQVRSVKEAGLLGASDRKIMIYAKTEGRVILTHDRDFGNLVNFPLQSHCGVVLIAYSDKSTKNVASKLPKTLDSLGGKVRHSLVIVTDSLIKIHKRHKN